MNVDQAKEQITKVLKDELKTYAEDLSESDTRSKLIDAVLVGVLGWKEQSIQREPSTDLGGYVDYLLHTSRVAFVIEAKKSSVVFDLPSTAKQRRFKIGGVLSEDKNLKAAINQCRNYGISKGCSFCCVTNGSQYIFFRSHSDLGVEFSNHQAIVFSGPDDVVDNFGLFSTLLSFSSVSEGRHVPAMPVAELDAVVSGFKELNRDSHRARYKNRNRLFPFVRDVVREVFQDLAAQDADSELLEQCYVESSGHGSYEQSLRGLVKNKPGLRGVQPLRVSRRSAGDFDGIVKNSKEKSEVVMVLGGIGAGKTTFLRRFRRVIAKDSIDKDAIWIEVDFNKYSDSPGQLDDWVANEIYDGAERADGTGQFGSYQHLKQSYQAEYDRLRRGRLAPLFGSDPVAFEAKFAQELEVFERAKISHVTRLLKNIQSNMSKRVFLIFDNADQFSASVQNDVFMLANRLSAGVGGSVVISLREESFWKNKDHGSLSAFHSMSYYVEAPDLKRVIAKRLKYATDLLRLSDYVVPSGGQAVTPEEGILIFESIRSTLMDDPRFVKFLQDLSPGEVRRPLDQLARFLYSGHTNVDSILRGLRSREKISIGFHEFFKSVAISDRDYFSEVNSDVVNIFALQGGADSSNLNRLAVLGCIHSFRRMGGDKGVGYVSLEKIVDICVSHGLQDDTVYAIIQLMNARRLVESEEQSRDNVAPSLFVRTTEAFDYYIADLARQFAYVDLIIPGTSIPAGTAYDMLERRSTEIYSVGSHAPNRIEKLELRIERAKLFAQTMAEQMLAHTMFRADGVVSDSVVSFLQGIHLGLERQGPSILEAAKRAFSRRA